MLLQPEVDEELDRWWWRKRARGRSSRERWRSSVRRQRSTYQGGAAWLEPEVKAPERPAWSEVGEMEGLMPAGSPSALPRLLCRRCHWRLGASTVQGTPFKWERE